METIDTTPEENTADQVINNAVMENDSSEAMLKTIEAKKTTLESADREKVNRYLRSMQGVYKEMIVRNFSGNVAGLYDGSHIFIKREVLMVNPDDMDRTIDQSTEIYDHERYHQQHHHTAPMKVVEGTRSDVALVLGTQEFDQTTLIEGLTVKRTGHKFVSDDYRGHERKLDKAMDETGLSIEDIEEAVNKKKDLTLIDDRTRENDGEESREQLQAVAA